MVILDGFDPRNIRYKENKTIENAEENDSDFHRPTYALHRNIKTPFPIQCVINVLDQRNAKQTKTCYGQSAIVALLIT